MCTRKPSSWRQKRHHHIWSDGVSSASLFTMHFHDKKSQPSLMSKRKRGLPRVAEVTSAQSEVPSSSRASRRRHCPKQLQLTHTALWSGPQSVKVWPWVHRLRRWLVTAIERSRKGLSAERTGTQRVAFSSDEEQKGKLTELAFFSETFEQI